MFKVLFTFATCPNNPLTNDVKIPGLHFFEKVNKGNFKMVSVNY